MKLLKLKLRPFSLSLFVFLIKHGILSAYMDNVYVQYVMDKKARAYFNYGKEIRGIESLKLHIKAWWWSITMLFFARSTERFGIEAFRWCHAVYPVSVKNKNEYWITISRMYTDYLIYRLSRRSPRGLFRK